MREACPQHRLPGCWCRHPTPDSAAHVRLAILPPGCVTPSPEDRATRHFSKLVPLPAFRGGNGGASEVGDVGESVLVEVKIWLVKAL